MALIDQYPSLRKAALEIAYDNGMINRNQTEEDWLASLDAVLGAEGVTATDLCRFDVWLCSLPYEDLVTLCAGEEQEAAAIATTCPVNIDGDRLTGLLTDIFEA